MSEMDNPSRDRREKERARATLQATCVVASKHYRARIFEVNHRGMTLICDPELPDVDRFEVVCRLKNARSFTFDVSPTNRQTLQRNPMELLRLGLKIHNATSWMDDFLCEFALERMRELSQEKTRLETVRDESASGHFGRGFQRLEFQLPAIAYIDGKSYRCNTLNVSTGGMRLWAPADFPDVAVFVMSYQVPDGFPVRLTAGVKNRLKDKDGGWQLGLRVMSGNRQFGAFLRRFKIWKAPES